MSNILRLYKKNMKYQFIQLIEGGGVEGDLMGIGDIEDIMGDNMDMGMDFGEIYGNQRKKLWNGRLGL